MDGGKAHARAGEVFHKVRYTRPRRVRDNGAFAPAASGGLCRRVLAGRRGGGRGRARNSMEKLEHELWIVQAVNAAFGPMVAALLRALGRPVPHGDVIPNYLVMAALIGVVWATVCLIVRRSLSVEHPRRLQILIEDA